MLAYIWAICLGVAAAVNYKEGRKRMALAFGVMTILFGAGASWMAGAIFG